MNKKHIVKLSDDERRRLLELTRTGSSTALAFTHARILLLADTSEQGAGQADKDIASSFSVSLGSIEQLRKRYCLSGLEACLKRAPTRRVQERSFDGRAEAHLIALACSAPPEGQARWSLRLLARHVVALEATALESVSHETVRQALKKMSFSLT